MLYFMVLSGEAPPGHYVIAHLNHHKYTDDHWEEHANQTLHSIMRRLDEWHVLNHTHGLPNAGDEVQELLSYAESFVFRVEGFGSSL